MAQPTIHFLSIILVICVILFYIGVLAGYEGCVIGWNLIYKQRAVALGLSLGITGAIFWCLSFWSYLVCAATDPGTIPDDWNTIAKRLDVETTTKQSQWAPRKSQWCEHCLHYRPERAHHCKSCNRCILRMDHHCEWMGNCLGLHNLKPFLLFSFWGLIAGLFMGSVSMWIVRPVINDADLADSQDLTINMVGLICCIADFVGSLLCLVFFVSFMSRIASNTSAVEENYKGVNPYNLGCVKNIEEIFGPFSWKWLFPIQSRIESAEYGLVYPLAQLSNIQATAHEKLN